MQPDPIVEEMREIRRQIEEENGADFNSYFKYLLESQRSLKDRLVRRKPKLLESADKA